MEIWIVIIIRNSITLQKWFWKKKLIWQLVHTFANKTIYISAHELKIQWLIYRVEDKIGKEVNNLSLLLYILWFALCTYLSLPLSSSCHKETIYLEIKNGLEGCVWWYNKIFSQYGCNCVGETSRDWWEVEGEVAFRF